MKHASLSPFFVAKSLRLVAVVAALLAQSLEPLRAGSVEQVPISLEDLSKELGFDLLKYRFKWDRPVYAKFVLQMKREGEGIVDYTAVGETAAKEHDITAAFKNLRVLRATLGLPEVPESGESQEITVRSPGASFSLPYAPVFTGKEGSMYRTVKMMQSQESLPLGRSIALYTKAGPYTTEQLLALKEFGEEFILAPMFLNLSVEFSTTPYPPEEDPPAEAQKSADPAKSTEPAKKEAKK